MCQADSRIFKLRLHLLIQIIALEACLQKTGGFARNWPITRAKIGCDLRQPNCTRVAASRMQIVTEWPPVACSVTEWPPVACKLHPRGRQSHAA